MYKGGYIHETFRTFAGRYRPDLAAAELSASSSKHCLGHDAGCKHFIESDGNRTDYALFAHASQPQMIEKAAGHSVIRRLFISDIKAPCPLEGQGVSVKTYADPDKPFRF